MRGRGYNHPTMTSTNWTLDASCLEQVACPLCSGRDFERLAHTDRYAMGLVTVGCLGCGLVMTNPQPTTDALVDFYANHYRHTYLCEDGGQRERAAPTLAYIHAQRIDRRTASTVSFLIQRGALKPGMVVLDIGASEGSMLKTVDDRVPLTRRIAIEPDPVFGSFAVQHAGCELHTTLDALLLSVSAPKW
jgi:hypothetical protein